MRITILVGALCLTGCTAHPSAPTPTPTPPTQYVTADLRPISEIKPTSPDDQMTAKRLVQAKKEGFRVVNKDGEELFCRTELRTGSHAVRDTTCLTAKQIDDMQARTQADLQNYLKPNTPPTGR
jgi:hypothetical protein